MPLAGRQIEVIHPANAAGIDIAQCHNGILDAEQCDWAVLPLRRRGKTYGDAQARGLCEIVLAAFEGVLLLAWGLGGLSPVYEAEEEGGSSVVWLEKQGLLEIFFRRVAAVWLAIGTETPVVGAARATPPGLRQAARAPGW